MKYLYFPFSYDNNFYKPLAFFFMILGLNTHTQIGVNTTNPNATLDIRSSNQAIPTNNDGISIQKQIIFMSHKEDT